MSPSLVLAAPPSQDIHGITGIKGIKATGPFNPALEIKKNFSLFVGQVFRTLNPGQPYLHNWHIDAIAHSLMLALVGKRPRQVINVQPRSLKSIITSVAYPALAIGLDPTCKVMCISYSDDLTRVFSRDFARVVEADWYRQMFPRVRWRKASESEYATTQGGGRLAVAVRGSVTGRGADIILIDDPIKAADAQKESERQALSEWFKNTLSSRLNDKKRGVIALVMQRVHVADLTSDLVAMGFHHLCLPSIAQRDEEIPIAPGLVYARKADEALHPGYEDLETLAAQRRIMGTEAFEAQYLQRPEMPQGNLFKRTYLPVAAAPKDITGRWWVSVDAALTNSAWSDFSAITLGYTLPGPRGPHIYLYDAKRGRWDIDELIRETTVYHDRIRRRYPDVQIEFIVEQTALGVPLTTALKRDGYKVHRQTPTRSKEERAYELLQIFREGRVSLVRQPGKDAWIEPFLAEVLTFPHGRYDDQVDSMMWGVYFSEKWVR